MKPEAKSKNKKVITILTIIGIVLGLMIIANL